MAGCCRAPSAPSPLPASTDHSSLTDAVGVNSVSAAGLVLSLSLPSNHPLTVLQPDTASTQSASAETRSTAAGADAPESGIDTCFIRTSPRGWWAYRRL